MERDIVQFVPFLKYKNDPIELAKETLEEIPAQLTSYMSSKKKAPAKVSPENAQHLNFFDEDRRMFIQNVSEMGYKKENIEALLNKGLPYNSLDLFTSKIGHQDLYKNFLADN